MQWEMDIEIWPGAICSEKGVSSVSDQMARSGGTDINTEIYDFSKLANELISFCALSRLIVVRFLLLHFVRAGGALIQPARRHPRLSLLQK